MISESAVLSKFTDFTRVAAPILYLNNNETYEAALNMVEHLMESIGEDCNRPENLLITLLAHAIENYESAQEQTAEFVNNAMNREG